MELNPAQSSPPDRAHGLPRLPWLVLAAMPVGVWLAFSAWKTGSSHLAFWSAVILLAAPALAVVPAMRHCERALRVEPAALDMASGLIRFARANVLVALSYAVVLWISLLGNLIGMTGFVIAFSVLCLVAASAFPWLARCEYRVAEWRDKLRNGFPR